MSLFSWTGVIINTPFQDRGTRKNPCSEIPLSNPKVCNMYEPPMGIDEWLDLTRTVSKRYR